MSKAVVLLSGGVDSTTLVAYLNAYYGVAFKDILGLIIRYGQRHDRELQAARDVAQHFGISYMELDLSEIFKNIQNPMMRNASVEVPSGTYAQQLQESEKVATYVPFRNGIFLSVAAAQAFEFGADYVVYGAHMDDAAGNAYPDCSIPFARRMNEAICEGTGYKIAMMAPFVSFTKAEIVKAGLQLEVPYELTWSCYAGGEKPCGKCGTCLDRLAAFEANGEKDPLALS